MSLDPVELLAQLVAIPSVSPMGREVSGPEYLETRLTEVLVRHFQRPHAGFFPGTPPAKHLQWDCLTA